MTIYAHSNNNDDLTKWQTLNEHAENTSKLAAGFATSFNSSDFAQIMALLHDLGKARDSFQSYLRRCNGIYDSEDVLGEHSHSGAGACWTKENIKSWGLPMAYCIAGHHAGLPDWSGGETPVGALHTRLNEEHCILGEKSIVKWLSDYGSRLSSQRFSAPFKFTDSDSSVSFWIRMLYSCLVDADFLDTEAYMQPEQRTLRTFGKPLEELSYGFFDKLDEKQRNANVTGINIIRAEIRNACENAAELPHGLFSLTVPTGGGKTLSGTAFALRHALIHGLKRIIYVIPYTSIIEQTADVLREYFGKDNVLEHHSNFAIEKETLQSRLASENWDASIIVTTTVQFFESLYSCKPSQCRKLHNIAESVVILDEVQLLPTNLLLPCSEAIRQLVQHYRTSVVLSTATQLNLPGIAKDEIREIIPETMQLYKRLNRTVIEMPSDLSKHYTWKDLAAELCSYEQVLCIVNTRRDCRELFDEMPQGAIHLSALMCGEHRSCVIADIKRRLKEHLPVRVISTQLVEAGVDIDFPVVYRSFTGLASIAQAAGRCNREGRMNGKGKVVVFMPPQQSPNGELRKQEYAMKELLTCSGGIDTENQNIFPEYFHILHGLSRISFN